MLSRGLEWSGFVNNQLIVRNLGLRDYTAVLAEMRAFTDSRSASTPDELWLLEHHPVFTQGQAGKAEHLLAPGDIPVVQSDRGGQVTYHGPGQLIGYLLIDLKRRELGVRDTVSGIENAVIALLAGYGIAGVARREAPGVYVDGKKISALGLRVRRGRTYHGLSLNVAMDQRPFERINPCGYAGLEVTQLADLGVSEDISCVGTRLVKYLALEFGYDAAPLMAGQTGRD